MRNKQNIYLNIPLIEANDIPGPEVIKLYSCSTQLSIKFSLLTDEDANNSWHFHIC